MYGYFRQDHTGLADPRPGAAQPLPPRSAESRHVPMLGPGAGARGVAGSGGTQRGRMSCPGWHRQEHSNTGWNSLSHRFRIGRYCGTGTRATALALVPPTTAANELWQ